MKAIFNILSKVFVQQFYIDNAGFFLFAFFFFFGMVNGGQLISYHQSLMLSIISSPVFTGMVMLGWLLYQFKCWLFCINVLHAADSSYLFVLKGLPALKQLFLFSIISALLYLPVFIYACFVIAMAFNKLMWSVAVLIAAYQLLLIVSGAVVLYKAVNSNKDSLLKVVLSKLGKIFQIHIRYNSFLIAYLLHTRKLPFAVIKIFSLLLLAVSFVRNADSFDADLFSIFFQIVMVAHAALVYYCVDFSESLMQQDRNLPIPWYRVAGRYLFTWGIVLLPETVFMFINNQGNLPVINILLLSLTAIAVLLMYTAIVYACNLKQEQYQLFVFIAFIVFFFLQKSGWQLITLFTTFGMAMTIFKAHYLSFEREI